MAFLALSFLRTYVDVIAKNDKSNGFPFIVQMPEIEIGKT